MQPKPMVFRVLVRTLVCAACIAFSAGAQQTTVPNRLTQPIDESNLVTLKGNTHPLARAEFDRGPAPAGLPLNRMLLVLTRSTEQETALEALLDQQQENASPNYHAWLTPEQFGQQFGPSDQDIQTVTSWLQSHGFAVARVSKGRTVIEFSGSAAQVQQTFHTEIHKYTVNGEDHWANASDPQIPAALAPVVAGLDSLNNFPANPMNVFAGTFRREKATGKITSLKTQFTFPLPCSTTNNSESFCNFGVGPNDFATIYDVPPLGTAANNGTGQTIAIVAETDINPQDFADFHTLFGLPASTLNVIHDGPDPGIVNDEPEADIDTQWSSAVAPGATIDFVVSESTETTLGVHLSAEYIVDNNLAGAMSESYGICELGLGTSGNQFFNEMWQQAAAQGITVFVSSGDQGSAVCDGGQQYARFGLEVNGFASTPYNVAVGGTDFNDISNFAAYWNESNNSANQSSALGYIPEMTWNDTCTNSEVFAFFGATTAEQVCNNSEAISNYGLLNTVAGSGGKSACTTPSGLTAASCAGGYAKPTWQRGSGVVLSDPKRDLPDVSLFASNGFNGSFYIVCEADLVPSNSCDLNYPYQDFVGFGGTSVSSPAFAGIMALIDQKYGRQGNANYVLYGLANQSGKTCTSAANPAASCVFYDIPAGSTNAVPCLSGSTNCTVTTPGDSYGVLSGYSTNAGYDLATGLGSVNVKNLVADWPQGSFSASSTSIASISPTTLNHGASVTVTINVKAQSGTSVPTGLVSLIADAGPSGQQAVASFPLSSGTCSGSPCAVATGSTNLLPGGTSYKVFARYPGDSTFGPSDSATQLVTVNAEASTTQVEIVTFNPNTGQVTSSNATSLSYGSFYFLRANVDSVSGATCANNAPDVLGCPTGTLTITDNGSPLDGTPAGSGQYTLNSQGYAEDQPIFLMAGQHNLIAKYSGDSSFKSNTSATDAVTVSKATTILGLTSSATTAQTGQYVVLTATVSTQAFAPASADLPTGTVQFLVGSNALAGQVTYVASSNSSTGFAQYVATLSANSLPVGSDTITAQYSGDPNYAQSPVSNSVVVNVDIATTTTITSSNSSIQAGQSVTFTATVTPGQSGGPAPTGTIQFGINGGYVGSPVPLQNGQAQYTTSSVPIGNIQIDATYSGDSHYAQSLGFYDESVTAIPTTTAVTTSNSSVQQGQSVTFTATITPSKSGGPTPTGQVQFLVNGVAPSNAITLNGSAQASFTTQTLSAGNDNIAANYLGDSIYAPSSGSASETVAAQTTFVMATNSPTITVISPGQSGSTGLAFTALNGFTGTATLTSSMCSGLPSESTCNFSPTTVNLTAQTTSQNVILSIVTTAPSATVPSARRFTPDNLQTPAELVLLCGLCLSLALAARRASRSRTTAILALTLLAAIATSMSCGGGSGSTGPPPNPGTPIGNYTVSVTVTMGSVTQTINNIALNVQ